MTISHSKYKVLDLFSGIGGFSLGLERTGGFITTAFCEICPKARKVLSKHWANVKQYTDIRELTNERLKADGIGVDVITGGFPCTDISCAGKGEGILAERSGLWSEMFRLIKDVQPQWAIIENVPALFYRGLTLVLQDLCEIGYMCEWHCISAAQIGAKHKRDRLWIIAKRIEVPNANGKYWRGEQGYATGERAILSHEQEGGTLGCEIARCCTLLREADNWTDESRPCRVVDGLPNRVHRLKQLGNSVVPQIPELIGNAILEVGA
jgi:DNA (cytosine-5)-methyltransferase 1